MFKINVLDTLLIRGMVSIVGKRMIGNIKMVKVGSILTDGTRTYEITGIPLSRYSTVEALRENICLLLKNDNIIPSELNGKTLELV